MVRPLSANVTAAVGERLRIPSAMLDVVYPRNQLTEAHIEAVARAYWDGETFQVDLMTRRFDGCGGQRLFAADARRLDVHPGSRLTADGFASI